VPFFCTFEKWESEVLILNCSICESGNKNGWKGMDVARKLNNQEYTEWTRIVYGEK